MLGHLESLRMAIARGTVADVVKKLVAEGVDAAWIQSALAELGYKEIAKDE